MPTSKDILYSSGKNDECYTPRYGVTPILKHIRNKFPIENGKITIWCPFDKEDSEFVKVFRENGYNVIATHIEKGEDFYSYEPKEHWDCIISNPPFSGKRQIFKRAMSFNKPFALMQILMFDKRIKFFNNGVVQNKITFSTGYLCWDFLSKDIICERLEIK
nr:MAG TPA: adenine-specific methyltransferase [Bacteriophage sp.]